MALIHSSIFLFSHDASSFLFEPLVLVSVLLIFSCQPPFHPLFRSSVRPIPLLTSITYLASPPCHSLPCSPIHPVTLHLVLLHPATIPSLVSLSQPPLPHLLFSRFLFFSLYVRLLSCFPVSFLPLFSFFFLSSSFLFLFTLYCVSSFPFFSSLPLLLLSFFPVSYLFCFPFLSCFSVLFPFLFPSCSVTVFSCSLFSSHLFSCYRFPFPFLFFIFLFSCYRSPFRL